MQIAHPWSTLRLSLESCPALIQSLKPTNERLYKITDNKKELMQFFKNVCGSCGFFFKKLSHFNVFFLYWQVWSETLKPVVTNGSPDPEIVQMQPSSSGLDENRNPTMKTTEILQGSVPQDGMSLTYSLNQTFHHMLEKCFIMSQV